MVNLWISCLQDVENFFKKTPNPLFFYVDLVYIYSHLVLLLFDFLSILVYYYIYIIMAEVWHERDKRQMGRNKRNPKT